MIPFDLPSRAPDRKIGISGVAPPPPVPTTGPGSPSFRFGVQASKPRVVPPPPVPASSRIGLVGAGSTMPTSGPGSPSFRLAGPAGHPGVVPPPPVPAGHGGQAADDGAPAISFDELRHKAWVDRTRLAITSRLDKQMAAAEKADDLDQIRHVVGQYAALDNGGFAGFDRYHQDRADAQAQRDHLARQDNPFGSMSPDDIWQANFRTDHDVAAADVAAQRRRISLAEAQAKASGTPANFSPADAQGVLEMRYPDVADLFVAGEKGGAKMGALSNIHAALVNRGVPGLDDPNSTMNQLIKTRVKQLYGETLPGQFDEPFAPSHFSPAAGMELTGSRLAALLGNIFTGRGPIMSQGYHDKQLATGQWWKAINQTPTP